MRMSDLQTASEVADEHHKVLVDEDVLWLEVEMVEVLLLQTADNGKQLTNDARQTTLAEEPSVLHHPKEVAILDKGHHVVRIGFPS